MRGGPVLVCPPHAKWGRHGDEPLPPYVVEVTEVNPPRGEKAVEWMLLTNEPVCRFEDAWRVAAWYERRWIVEELHKAQKAGCHIVDLRFTKLGRLEPAIALLLVAVTLLNLRDASRREDAATRRATTLIATDYVNLAVSENP